jgi:mRNA turnover protein 4
MNFIINLKMIISVSLTRTTKKGPQLKTQLVEEIRKCVENYARIFVFGVQNMRNNKLKDIREEWKQSR